MQRDYSSDPITCICENSKYLKNIPDTSVTECDEVVIGRNIVSTKLINTIATKKTNTIATNVTSTASLNCYCKKVRDCYILHIVLLGIIILLIIILLVIIVPNNIKDW